MYNIYYDNVQITKDDSYILQNFEPNGIAIRTSSQKLTGQNGGIVWKQLYDMRTIGIEVIIIGNNASDYFTKRDMLMQLFTISDNTKELRVELPNGVTRRIQCKVYAVDEIKEEVGEIWQGDLHIVLIAPEFLWRDGEHSLVLNINDTSYIGGSPVPSPVPSALGYNKSAINIINVKGIDNYPYYELLGDVTNPTITNRTTGEWWRLEGTIDRPTYVYKDSYGVHAGVEGAKDFYSDILVGTFFKLQEGDNILSYKGTKIDDDVTATIKYSNCYVGI